MTDVIGLVRLLHNAEDLSAMIDLLRIGFG